MNLSDFKLGWLVGDFEPSLFKSKDVEFAIKYYEAGIIEPKHVHKIAVEYTIIVEGKVKVNDITYTKGDIIKIEKNIPAVFETIEKTITAVIKTPSVMNDKYLL